MHKKIDNIRYQKEERKYYINVRNNLKYQKKLFESFDTDTGFDRICSSCLQYKSMQYCKSISILNDQEKKKYIVNNCALLKNKTDDQFVCNLCLKDIKKDRVPKRNHRSSFRFANFPKYLIEKLKNICAMRQSEFSSGLTLDEENYERQAMQLNKLEAYLLKLCIPFIRIAHCPRGSYFKVKGDLILISSDLSHSLNKILPIQQSLIPVAFKRKLSYTGSYIEQYVETEKVKMYFSWFKKYNHLYKDLELDTNLVEEFKVESVSASKDFERVTRKNEEEIEPNVSEDETDECIETEEVNEVDFSKHSEIFEPYQVEEKNISHDQTTMFFNKYCEDVGIPSVANRMAESIVNYEINKHIAFNSDDDFEDEDEIITEEEFLANIDDEMNQQAQQTIQEVDIEECLVDISNTHMEVNDEIIENLDIVFNPSDIQSEILATAAKEQAKVITSKMEKICVAPGETGNFENWGKDVFLEEKCFPEKFPYGTGGYLSSCVNDPKNDMGFANYCINQLMSCDPKFRQDSSYIFFLLLVKELIQLKRCKTTYFRQATRMPNLSRNDVLNLDKADISRFNRSYEVFKNVRGTSMYYEQSKKNLMALLRQNGCPTLFLTLSCAEFDWPELLREILETVYRKKVSQEDIDSLSASEKNRIISENVVQSTIHFQKRIDKIFSLMKYDFFKGDKESYHVSSYFYRIEFQQRGAPHVHSLLWLKNQKDEDAPNIWIDQQEDENNDDGSEAQENDKIVYDELKVREVEKLADFLISTSSEDMFCDKHNFLTEAHDCADCALLKDKVDKFQSHNHTFTCAKKNKTISIKANEGHGRMDNHTQGPELSNISICRFRFPKFPLDETKLVFGMPKDTEEDVIKERKKDLNKIVNYLIRQTHVEKNLNDSDTWKTLEKMTFWEFLFEVGMFSVNKKLEDCTEKEKKHAKLRYLNAIAVSVQGTAIVVLKRKVKDIFINGYNKTIMKLQKSNHDIQICIDQYSCAQYVCGYLTKNESGISKLLKAVNEETSNLTQIDKLNALASVLDKHREVSVQEAIYRLLSLNMTKSSVIVKYLSTIHPNFRDGLLKGNIESLEESDSIFHNSPQEYFENRPEESDDPKVNYDEMEQKKDYWNNMSLSEFWSDYDIVYGNEAKKRDEKEKTKIICLKNNKGYIRKRTVPAVLRYYLNYTNDEDLARGLLILFFPFRNEMEDIHTQDVEKILSDKKDIIQEKRKRFEKYKVMTDLITNIQSQYNEAENKDDEENGGDQEVETTAVDEIEDFNQWARNQATKDLSKFKSLTDLCDMNMLRSNISSLNFQQRRIFDDFTERSISTDVNEKPVYLYIAGNAGTGKSFLVKLLIEAVKIIKMKAGNELKKPPVIVMAPTANAAFIIGGKTIDSVLGFTPVDKNRYTEASPGLMAMMKFQYENVHAIFCDEISMVGAMKLAKINFRLQDLANGDKKHDFMGGISFVASGMIFCKS